MFKYLSSFVALLVSSICYAQGQGIGGVAEDLVAPAQGLAKIICYVSFIGGTGFLLGAVIQYKAHRDNPSAVRLSAPIFLLFFGLALIGLPFIGRMTGYVDFGF